VRVVNQIRTCYYYYDDDDDDDGGGGGGSGDDDDDDDDDYYYIYLYDYYSYLYATRSDLLVFAISSVATYRELDLWTWSVIKSVWIYQVEFEYLALRYPCSCLRFE